MTLEADAVLWLRTAVATWFGPTDTGSGDQDGRHGGRPLQNGGPQDITGLNGAAVGQRLGHAPLALSEPADWPAIQRAAGRHNLEPLLFDLVERGEVSVPRETRDIWEGQYYRNQIFNHALFETLAALLAAAEENGANVIVLKGPVSIARRLRDPGLRVMVDLDLLCRQVDLAVLAEIALDLGFRAVGENATYHLAFQHPELGAGLELHFDLYEAVAERRKFLEQVINGAEVLEVDGVSFLAPSLPAEVVLQLAHLLNHDYRADLRHWLDFALACADAAPRQPEVRRLLRLSDLEPEYSEAVAITSELFEIDPGARGRKVEPEIFSGIEAGLLDLRDDRAFLAGARVHSSWWARARYAARLVVPSPGRWRALSVSEDSGVGTALFRHLSRVLRRGRTKVKRRADSAAPADSPRARLFRRRKGGRRGHNT
ncbi:MAG: nucleotidyltransferase family protein [bacterium]|nr:nucleotidyltransferase family protein [bacterium]